MFVLRSAHYSGSEQAGCVEDSWESSRHSATLLLHKVVPNRPVLYQMAGSDEETILRFDRRVISDSSTVEVRSAVTANVLQVRTTLLRVTSWNS